MKIRLPLVVILALLTCSCMSAPPYVLPEKSAVAKLCHVFIANDFHEFKYAGLNDQRLVIEGLKYNGSALAFENEGYMVYPAPIGPIHLTFSYTFKDMFSMQTYVSSSVHATCKEGGVVFAYVKSTFATSAAYPGGQIATDSWSKEVEGPLASELLDDVFRKNKPVYIDKLADYVLNGAKARYFPEPPPPAPAASS